MILFYLKKKKSFFLLHSQMDSSHHQTKYLAHLVDFNTRDDVLLNKHVNDLPAISGGLVECFLKEDGTWDVSQEQW